MKSLDDLDIATPSDNGTEIELLHPVSGEPTGIFFSIVGKHSEKYAAQKREIDKEQIEAVKKLSDKDKLSRMLDTEDSKARAVRLLAACVTGWRTVELEPDKKDPEKMVEVESKTLNFEGKDHAFSVSAAAKVLSSRKWSWVYAQVDQHVHNDSLFMKP